MSKLKIDFSDGLKQEMGHRVSLRLGWLGFLIMGIIALGFYSGKRYFFDKNFTPTQRYVASVVDDFKVRRHFDGRVYGTFWDHCGQTITADHVVSGMADGGAEFVGQDPWRPDGVLDVASYGDWKCGPPKSVAEGVAVSLIGYPGGSADAAIRRGKVYFHRSVSGSAGYEVPTWIVVFETREPVVGGMSGGIVIDEDRNPLGVIVVQNSPSDLDGDEIEDHSADIVALSDYYEANSNGN